MGMGDGNANGEMIFIVTIHTIQQAISIIYVRDINLGWNLQVYIDL